MVDQKENMREHSRVIFLGFFEGFAVVFPLIHSYSLSTVFVLN